MITIAYALLGLGRVYPVLPYFTRPSLKSRRIRAVGHVAGLFRTPPKTNNLITINYATMSWMEQDENKLLQRSFFFGMTGILFCMVPLFNRNFHFWDWENINILTGIGIGVQLFALSIAVLVIRKRKISHEAKNKAQRMAIALTVALIFFFMV